MNSSAGLIVFCRLSLSGKSTIGQRLARSVEASIVSLDAINEHTAHCEPPARDEPHHTIESTNSNNEAEVSALVARISAMR